MPTPSATAQVGIAVPTLVVSGNRAHDTGDVAAFPTEQPFWFVLFYSTSHGFQETRIAEAMQQNCELDRCQVASNPDLIL